MKTNISAVVLTHNSVKFVGKALKSLKWCDEIVVIDDVSDDGIERVAKKYKAKFYRRKMDGDFATQRNFAYTKVKNDWILFVDADEAVTKGLKNEIEQKFSQGVGEISAFGMRRNDYFLDHLLKYGPAGQAYFWRLVNKKSCRWVGKIFEIPQVDGWQICLESRLDHYRHEGAAELVIKANYYSDLEAKMLFKNKVKPRPKQIIWDPIVRFCHYYFWQKAFLDGIPGLIFVVLGSVLVKQLTEIKLWIKWAEKK